MVAQGETLLIKDARLIFRNFAGKQQQFNNPGDRNFAILLDPDMAAGMAKDGWNVKHLKPREEGDEPQAYIQVKVEYEKGRPPRVVLVSSKGRNDLGASEVELIDAVDIKKADVLIRAYNWQVNDNTGTKAYLKTAFITMNEDELELLYSDLQPADDDPIHDEEE